MNVVASFSRVMPLNAASTSLVAEKFVDTEPVPLEESENEDDLSLEFPWTTHPRTEPRVLLLGDSTLASLRWFKQGTVSLKGFQFSLDVESCRKIAYKSCFGREFRTPDSALTALKNYNQPLDYVVLMAGYHATISDIAKEFSLFYKLVQAKNAKLIFLSLRESLSYPLVGSGGKRSVFNKLNQILKDLVMKKSHEDVIIADWNSFSHLRAEWFGKDGIHPNIIGTVALGWFISQTIAVAVDHPCPFDDSYPCEVQKSQISKKNWLEDFNVKKTNTHCYEDGEKRKRVCTNNRR